MVLGQRRGRAIAMSADEMDSFLGEQRTCRMATLGPGGGPHVSPVWFVWLRITPLKIISWDFRKLADLKTR
jgi:nitroimidazol reductase NimA-like FMN-containing flavoprotein (pyridoxamine 5'-phosphate oxidase superfamily)